MKLRNFALSLAATALLSTLVYAGDNMDAISSSLERVYSPESDMLPAMAANDPFVTALAAMNSRSGQPKN